MKNKFLENKFLIIFLSLFISSFTGTMVAMGAGSGRQDQKNSTKKGVSRDIMALSWFQNQI